MKIVVIEGNIGCGKSTLLKPLCAELEARTLEPWTVLVEPVDEDAEFHRLLKIFIDNPTDANKRAEFQNYMTTMRAELLSTVPDGNYILERSLFSDLVFTHTNMLSTSAPTGEYWNCYWDIAKRLEDYPKPDVLVYLSREPQACLESCMKRDRAGEGAYDIDYFTDLHRFHLACLPQVTRKYQVPYVEMNLGASYAAAAEVADHIINNMSEF
ncbi:MAG: deoxynucleoside kinase [Bacteroidales bacterium]